MVWQPSKSAFQELRFLDGRGQQHRLVVKRTRCSGQLRTESGSFLDLVSSAAQALGLEYIALLRDPRYATLQSVVDLLLHGVFEPPTDAAPLTLRERRLATNGEALQERMLETANSGYISTIPSPGRLKTLQVLTEFGVYKPDTSSMLDSRELDWPEVDEVLFRRHKIVLSCVVESRLAFRSHDGPRMVPVVSGADEAFAGIDIPSPPMSPARSASCATSYGSAASAPSAFSMAAAPSARPPAPVPRPASAPASAPSEWQPVSPGSWSLPACSPASSLCSVPQFSPAAFGPGTPPPHCFVNPFGAGLGSFSPPVPVPARYCPVPVVPRPLRPIRKAPAKSRKVLGLTSAVC